MVGTDTRAGHLSRHRDQEALHSQWNEAYVSSTQPSSELGAHRPLGGSARDVPWLEQSWEPPTGPILDFSTAVALWSSMLYSGFTGKII